MGLDLDFSRIKRKTGEALLDERGQIDYYDGSAAEEELLYYRKNWSVMEALNEMFEYPPQTTYIPLTKLQAHHLWYMVQQRRDKSCAVTRKKGAKFIQEFGNLLKTFDWDNYLLTFNWIS
jgi:hypothetical protein